MMFLATASISRHGLRASQSPAASASRLLLTTISEARSAFSSSIWAIRTSKILATRSEPTQRGDTGGRHRADPATSSFHRCAAVRQPQRRSRARPLRRWRETESLTTDLSRISGAFVVGRHTAFAYKGEARDLKKIGRELNVRYVLEGSVQRSDKRFRVNVQLVDAETANHIWAERFDKPFADLFDMQDEVVSRLANTLNAQLIEAEARRAEHSPHPNSLDYYFQGVAWFNKGPTPDHMAQARAMFERALALDPNNIEALVWTAAVNLEVASAYMSDDQGALVAVAEAMLLKVLSLAPNHAF